MPSHDVAAGRSFAGFVSVGVAVAAVVAATAVVLSASPQAQAPVRQSGAQPPVFRSGVRLVEVDAVATDAQGRPVIDLTNISKRG